MRPHWHDRYFQLHYLVTGRITLQLDEHFYSVRAPLFVLTPPSVPHTFFTDPDSDGHVLTVRQEFQLALVESSGLVVEMPQCYKVSVCHWRESNIHRRH